MINRRKIFILFLTVMYILFISVTPVFALSQPGQSTTPATIITEPGQRVAITESSEFEAILDLKSSSNAELKAAGYNNSDIIKIRAFSLEKAVLERARLPEETLRNMGYTDYQIQLLKNYKGLPITKNSPIMAASATLYGVISLDGWSNSYKTIQFNYSWSWSAQPLALMTDGVGVNWRAYNATGGLQGTDIVSKSHVIKEYYMNTMNFFGSKNVSVEPDGIYDGVESHFSIVRSTLYEEYWARSGILTIKLASTGSQAVPFEKVDVAGAYGHAIISLSWTISIGSYPNISVNTSVNKLGTDQVRFTY